jgi:hypothetical protein
VYDELEVVCKEAVVTQSKLYSSISLQVRENHAKMNQDSRCPGRDSNLAPLGALHLDEPVQRVACGTEIKLLLSAMLPPVSGSRDGEDKVC